MPLNWDQIKEEVRSKPLIKEKWKRDIYARWMTELLKRRDARECPRCGAPRETWVKRGSGFFPTWMCDDCGLVCNKKDFYKGNIYFDFITLKEREEIKRIKSMRKRDQMVKNYEKDGI